MIRTSSFLSQFVSGALSVILPLSMMPATVFATIDAGSKTDPFQTNPNQSEQRKIQPSRKLTSEELKDLKGKNNGFVDANPYVAGTNKWDVVHNGVNLMTGNFTTSATDLSFEGGYGIPVNMTRSYSANSPDEGPFGTGWTMSVDIRSTAGGILKSSGAPIRSVPVNFKERPVTQDDPSTSGTEPVEAVVTTDAAGKETTVQRDVDGVLTTPPWDKNEIDSVYEMVVAGSNTYEILVSNTVRTPEGTIYVYEEHGKYKDDEQYTINNPTGATAPSNILKIVSVTDRHGNPTNYTYSSGTRVEFFKYNGTVEEDKLTGISMPGSRSLSFTWGNGTTGPTDRITSVTDGTRTVTYEYDGAGNLAMVTSPEGRETTYTYDGHTGESLTEYTGGPTLLAGENDVSLLTHIKDCRGLETKIYYCAASDVPVWPYGVTVHAVVAWKVELPNGVTTYVRNFDDDGWPTGSPYASTYDYYTDFVPSYVDKAGSAEIERGDLRLFVIADVLRVVGSQPTMDDGNYQSHHTTWIKDYLTENFDCVFESRDIRTSASLEDVGGRHWPSNPNVGHRIETESNFNCFGAPLAKEVSEFNGSSIASRVTLVEYAYWGADKYYQQRAVRSPKEGGGYRYSFTDYFKDDAADGSKGQTKRVWGPDVFGSYYDWVDGTNNPIPDGTSTSAPDDRWKYQRYPQNYTVGSNNTSVQKDGCSAEFAYDSDGRPTDVWKIPAAGVTGTYIQTKTGYGGGEYGLPHEVTEAYGTGNARTTTTDDYDPIGRATIVTDALGREFTTTYNLDGQVLSVEKTDGPGEEGEIVTYTYGDDPGEVEHGMVLSVLDNLTGYKEIISYRSEAGGGKGQVESVSENYIVNDPSIQHSVSYTYNDAGDRDTATYVKYDIYGNPITDQTARWKYKDYTQVGFAGDFKRVFQTLNKQAYVSSAWVDSTEETHYKFDSSGRLIFAAFAQFPDFTDGASPEVMASYTEARPAEKRIIQANTYDAAGRLAHTATGWQTQTFDTLGAPNGFTDPTPIYANSSGYSSVLALKASSGNSHYVTDFNTPDEDPDLLSGWNWNELYQYDANLDYLTYASYDNGTSNRTWAYDYAGNRSSDSGNSGSWTYDELNRMTACPDYNYENDAVGNRTGRNMSVNNSAYAVLYGWDELNRMEKLVGVSTGYRNEYRADGMRMKKVSGFNLSWTWHDKTHTSGYYDEITGTNLPTTRYFYDGQMCVEDEFTDNGTVTSTKYGLGARGIDYISTKVGTGAETGAYPVYDGHGNMVLILAKSGDSETSPSYTSANRRNYDVWGSARTFASVTSPTNKQRYCANLGHVEDDESGLQYMRARFYEPWTGRFVSEDPALEGLNWYVYATNMPSFNVDPDGKHTYGEVMLVNEQGEVLEAHSGSVAFRVKVIAENKIRRLFEGNLRQRASEAIHKLKDSLDMKSTDDFLYDYAKDMLFKIHSTDPKAVMCLGTLKALCEEFLEFGGF